VPRCGRGKIGEFDANQRRKARRICDEPVAGLSAWRLTLPVEGRTVWSSRSNAQQPGSRRDEKSKHHTEDCGRLNGELPSAGLKKLENGPS